MNLTYNQQKTISIHPEYYYLPIVFQIIELSDVVSKIIYFD